MSRNPRKSVAVLAVVMSFLLVFLLVADYVFGVRSDAMRLAQAELAQSAALQDSIGPVRDVRLRKLWGYGVTPGVDDEARLSVVVVGERGEKELTLHMKKVDGRWTIARASQPL